MNFLEAVSRNVICWHCAVTPEKENIQYSRKNGKERELFETNTKKYDSATTSGKNHQSVSMPNISFLE